MAVRSDYKAGAAGDLQYQNFLKRESLGQNLPNLPSAPSAQLAPVGLATTPQGQAKQQLQTGLDQNGQQLGVAQTQALQPRDFEKEAKMIKQLGGPPQNAQEFDTMMRATYSPTQLASMGWKPTAPVNTGVAGTQPIFDPAALKAQGYSDAQIQQLSQSGNTANQMQQNANSLSTPNNMNLRVLENALNIKNNVTNQNLGQSDLFKQAGLTGMSTLQQSLGQRATEMNDKYNSFKQTVSDAAAPQLEAYNQALNGYKATMEQYNHLQDQLFQANEKAKDHERELDLLNQKSKIDKDMYSFQLQQQAKAESQKPDFQFIPETEDQAAGYFDKNTGQFTPLSVGGNAYKPVSYGEYSTAAESSNGNSFIYSTPQPHGAVNEQVVASNPKLINIYENGYKKAAGPTGYGGQCAYEAEQWTNLPKVGNSLQEKASSLAKFVNQGIAFYKGGGQPEVGYSVISNDDPNHGHVWVINAKTADGKLVASEFNRAGSRVYSNNRVVDPNDKSILGFVKTTLKPEYQVEKAAQKVSQNVDEALKSYQGLGVAAKTGLATIDALTGGIFGKAVKAADKSIYDAQLQRATAGTNPNSMSPGEIAQGMKAGTMDENGVQLDPQRQLIRAGQADDAMITDLRKKLTKAVNSGRLDPAALDQFNSDTVFGKFAAKDTARQQKLQDAFMAPPTDSQGKALGFALSSQQAENQIQDLSNNIKSLGEINTWITRSNNPNGIISDKLNQIKSPEARKLAQSELQWIANVLRAESGAAIAQSEYINAGNTYFPRPGDTQEDLNRKAKAREQKINNLLYMAGPSGAKAWQNNGNKLPDYISNLYGMGSQSSDNDPLGLHGSSNNNDPLSIF